MPTLAGGLPALELVQRLVELPLLYGGLVAGEFGERVGLIGVPNESTPERGTLRVSLGPHLLDPLQGLPVLAFVNYFGVAGF